MYYFSKNDIVKIDHHTVIYRIPHSKKTTWTTFKYGYIGNKLNMPQLSIKIISGEIDQNATEQDTVDAIEKKENTWYSTKPIRSTSFLYFKVIFPCLPSLETGIRILLVGTIRPKIIKQKHMLSN
jgi:hypothetical protein